MIYESIKALVADARLGEASDYGEAMPMSTSEILADLRQRRRVPRFNWARAKAARAKKARPL